MHDSETPRYDYRAFISYSHKDDAWARWLIGKLETYKVPPEVAGPNGTMPPTLGKFFRDRDETSASEDLATTIREALRRSEHMIVLASPAAAQSRYVDAEIREFAALNERRSKPGRILTLIVGGVPNVPHDAPIALQECLPPALRGGLVNADGSTLEPLAADARPIGDGRTRALSKLVSGLLDIRYDLLVRRDLVRRRKRRSAVAAALAMLVVAAGAVVWRIESDRLERERLAEESALIERERRTLAAVNDAERAADLLAAGKIEDAVALARPALVVDGSIPVIPQAFDVLYRARIAEAAPMALELGDGFGKTYALAGGEYITIEAPLARVWSRKGAIVSARSDLSVAYGDASAAAQDGSAAFMRSESDELRYRAGERAWERISMPEDIVGYVVADASTLYACTDTAIVGLGLPGAGNGAAEIAWQAPLAEGSCRGLALAPDGALLVALDDGGMIDFDIREREVGVRYAAPRPGWYWDSFRDPVRFAGDYFLAEGRQWALYRRGQPEPLHLFDGRSTDRVAISPDGRVVAITTALADGDDLHVRDLASGAERSIRCLCSVIGFDMDDRLLVGDSDGIVHAYDPENLERIGEVYRFKRRTDNVLYLHETDTLLGFNAFGLDEVVPVVRDVRKGVVATGEAGTTLHGGIMLGEATVAYLGAVTDAGSRTVAYEANAVDMAGNDPAPLWQSARREKSPFLEPVADDLLMVAWRDGMEDWPADISLVDVGAGEVVFEELVRSAPALGGVERDLVIETANGLLHVRPGAEPEVLVGRDDLDVQVADWSVVGRLLFVGRRAEVSITDLDAATALPGLMLDGEIVHFCAAPDGEALYVISASAEAVRFEKWSVAGDPSRLARLDLPLSENGRLIGDFLSLLAVADRALRGELVHCDDGGLAIGSSGEEHLLWNVAENTYDVVVETGSKVPAEQEPSPGTAITAEELAAGRVARYETSVALLSRDARLLFRTPELGSPIRTVLYIPDRRWLVVGLENGRVEAWDAGLGNTSPIVSLDGHPGAVDMLDVNESGTLLLTGDSRKITVWPVMTPEEMLDLYPG